MSSYQEFLDESTRGRLGSERQKSLAEAGSFRPTLYIGLGGFGCAVIRKVKRSINEYIPDPSNSNGFRFIGMDTHGYDSQTDILALTEYVPLSIGVHPDTVARNHPEALGWYLDLCHGWKARNLNGGADKVKAAGRLSLLFPPTLAIFMSRLDAAFNELIQFRDQFAAGSPKIYIVSSIGGGTGAGCFLDTSIIVRQRALDVLGADVQVQAVLAGPDALQGEAGPTDMRDFNTNAYATLKELLRFVRGQEERMHYAHPSLGTIQVGRQHMPDPLFVVTDRNEGNKAVVKELKELGDLVVSYLQNEIKTPMKNSENGAPKPQDKENPSGEHFGHGDMPKAISSIGVVQVGMPWEIMRSEYIHKLIVHALDQELAASDVAGEVTSWIAESRLAEDGSDQLQNSIRSDQEGQISAATIVAADYLVDVKRQDLGRACAKMKSSAVEAINAQHIANYEKNAATIIDSAAKALNARLDKSLRTHSIGTAYNLLKAIREALQRHEASLTIELADANQKLTRASIQVDSSIRNVGEAAAGDWYKRASRIRSAIDALEGDLQLMLNLQLASSAMERGLSVYQRLLADCGEMMARWEQPVKALRSRREAALTQTQSCEAAINKAANINVRGPGNRFSLVDAKRSSEIFAELFSREKVDGVCQRAREYWRTQNLNLDTSTRDGLWLERCQSTIAADVEDIARNFDLLRVLDRYYPSDVQKKELFATLASLGAPLFPLDPNLAEPCQQYWIVATHPSISDTVGAMCRRYFDTEGLMRAYFESPHEIIIYSIKHGYTLHSMARVASYHSDYNSLLAVHRAALLKKITARPVHGWPGAEKWEEIAPRAPSEKDAYKWFVLGRAFNVVFPTPDAVRGDGTVDDRKNVAFLSCRGANYYVLEPGASKSTLVGNGLPAAFETLGDRPDLQAIIRAMIEAKVRDLGEEAVARELAEKYSPLIAGELEVANNGADKDRAELIGELKKAFDAYLKVELKRTPV
jgi:hypothetical protein